MNKTTEECSFFINFLFYRQAVSLWPVSEPVRHSQTPTTAQDDDNKLLEKDRNLRYQHASDLRADLVQLRHSRFDFTAGDILNRLSRHEGKRTDRG